MAHVNRRIGKSSESAINSADGTGGGVLDAFLHDYFRRSNNIYNAPGISPTGMTASGGVINDYTSGSNIYRTHIFTSSGTFNVTTLSSDPALPNSVEYLVVAGGGGGGGNGPPGDGGGGGGAGGLRTNLSGHPLAGPAFPVSTSPGSYTVTVGAGGISESPIIAPGGKSIQAGQRGNPSVFGPITSTGGGAGGAVYSSYGQTGGSGGGAGIKYSSDGSLQPASTGTGNSPPVSPSQGNPGGGSRHSPGSAAATGGGGGAGGAGGDAPSTNTAGVGGIGSQVLIAGPPASVQPVGTPGPNPGGGYFAGGGGGSKSNPGTGGSGGSGGGGAGVANSGDGTRGTTSTGGGGGGARNGVSGQGGSGIVVVRYQIGTVQTAKATGGAISFYGGKTIHTFLTSGTFATTSDWSAADVEYLVVGGGGAGGTGSGYGGGGGGAGGFKTGTTPIGAHPVSTTIQVGAGGGGASAFKAQGIDGTPSYFGTPITSTGGGGGGYDDGSYSTKGNPGGSGGGNGGGPQGPGGPNAGSPPQGYPGGDAGPDSPDSVSAGGGGGGAGGAGADFDDGTPGRDGGPGGLGRQIPATFRNPVSVTSLGAPGPTGPVPGTNPGGDTSGKYWVAGGGAGGGAYGQPGSIGGGGGGGTIGTPYAGGGDGGPSSVPGSGTIAKAGIQNTGAGGGGYGGGPNPVPSGSYPHRIGGAGGSGIVLIAYPT